LSVSIPSDEQCPSHDVLRQWFDDTLSLADSHWIEQHVGRCDRCRQELSRLDASQLEALREFAGLTLDTTRSQSCRRAIDAIRRLIEESHAERSRAVQVELQTVETSRIGPYAILRELGRGGMGRVFLARHLPDGDYGPSAANPLSRSETEQLVALKVLQGDSLGSQSGRLRFSREAKYALALQHPNLIKALETGLWSEVPYLVMEFLPGDSLAELIRRRGRVSIGAACEIARQAAHGLSAVHEAGLIHRDVKPSNLILTQDLVVKVLDLGLARIADLSELSYEVTQTGQFLGTVSFVAPEQLINPKQVDHRADVYSLACTLFSLLTGRPPYSGPDYETAWQIASAHTADEVPLVSQDRPEVPDELATALQAAMSPRPETRPQSMQEFADVFGKWAVSRELQASVMEGPVEPDATQSPATITLTVPVSGTSPQADTHADSTDRRTRLLTGVVIGLAVGLLTLAAFAMNGLFQSESQIDAARPIGAGSEDPVVSGSLIDQEVAAEKSALDDRNVSAEESQSQRGTELQPLSADFVWQQPLFPLAAPEDREGELKFAIRSGQTQVLPRLMSPVEDPVQATSWILESRRPRADLWRSAFSSDGRYYVVGGNSGLARIYDAATDQPVRILAGEAPVTALDWSPAGPWLLVGAANGSVTIWDVPQARRLRRFEHESGRVSSAEWSSDGTRVLFSGSGEITSVRSVVDDFATEFRSPPGQSTIAAAWAPEGKRLAVTDASLSVRIWNCETLLQDAVIEHGGKRGMSLAWSLDGDRIAVCCDGGDVAVINVANEEVVHRLTGHQQSFFRQALWMPDGAGLLVNDGVFLHLYDERSDQKVSQTGNPLGETHAKEGGCVVSEVAVSPDGKSLVCPLRYRRDIWRLERTEHPPQSRLVHRSSELPCLSRRLALSPDRRLAAVTDTSAGLWLWDLENSQPLAPPTAVPTHEAAWSPDGTQLAVANYGPTQIFNVANNELQLLSTAPGKSYSIEWSSDGQQLAAGGQRPGFVKLVDPLNWIARPILEDLKSPVFSIAWSPDSQWVAAGTLKEVFLIDARTLEVRHTVPFNSQCFSLAWHPHEPVVAAMAGFGHAYLIDVETGKYQEIGAHRSGGGSVAWSAGGQTLVTGTVDNLIGWSYPECRKLWTMPNDGVSGSSIAFGPDDRSLLVASDCGLRSIDLETLRTTRTFVMFADGAHAVIPASGEWSGSPGVADRLLYVVDTPDGQELLAPDEFSALQH